MRSEIREAFRVLFGRAPDPGLADTHVARMMVDFWQHDKFKGQEALAVNALIFLAGVRVLPRADEEPQEFREQVARLLHRYLPMGDVVHYLGLVPESQARVIGHPLPAA